MCVLEGLCGLGRGGGTVLGGAGHTGNTENARCTLRRPAGRDEAEGAGPGRRCWHFLAPVRGVGRHGGVCREGGVPRAVSSSPSYYFPLFETEIADAARAHQPNVGGVLASTADASRPVAVSQLVSPLRAQESSVSLAGKLFSSLCWRGRGWAAPGGRFPPPTQWLGPVRTGRLCRTCCGRAGAGLGFPLSGRRLPGAPVPSPDITGFQTVCLRRVTLGYCAAVLELGS